MTFELLTVNAFLIVDDHPLFREALAQVICDHFPNASVSQASSLQQALSEIAKTPDLDLILLDLHLPNSDGLNGLMSLRQQFPAIAVAMISADDDKTTVLQAMAFGAAGFISKSSSREQLNTAIAQIMAGNVYLPAEIFRSNQPNLQPEPGHNGQVHQQVLSLTRSQLKVLQLMVRGDSNKQIAFALEIAETTVKVHVSAILSKLGVSNRVQAILLSQHLDFDNYLKR